MRKKTILFMITILIFTQEGAFPDMKVWASLHKNNETLCRVTRESDHPDASEALMECLEQIYKELDIAEPVWVKKHAQELSRYQRVKFLPEDFLESVSFDSMEIEFSME